MHEKMPERIWAAGACTDNTDGFTRGEWICEERRESLVETYGEDNVFCNDKYLKSTPVLEHADGLKKAALAYQELSVCYRINKRPTERLFDRLEKAGDLLATIEAEEAK